jgi:ATP/maltotriose-dependent transcriptional regulator MalT
LSPVGLSVPVLVVTKLQVPELRSGLVPRDELVARLVDGEGRKLALVCAGGVGKSILFGEWHAAAGEGGRLRGCRWMRVTTTRCGSGVM